MRARSLALWLLLAITSAVSATDVSRDEPTAKLIAQLADPQYALRRDAAWRLLEAGPRVSDALRTAQTGADPELAAASARLVEQLTPQWTKFDASPTIKAAMQRYAKLDATGRYNIVRELLDEPTAALGALCRIARFEPSPLVSRLAAAAIIGELEDQADQPAPTFSLDELGSELTRLDQAFGQSNRDSAQWLTALVADESPTKRLELWRQFVTAEQHLADAQPGATSPVVMWTLVWQTLRMALASDDPAAALETWDAIAKMAEDDPRLSTSSVPKLLTAISDAKAWRVGDAMLTQRSTIFDTKLRKYLAAELRRRQGAEEEAAQIADAAARFITPEALDPFAQQKLDERYFVAIALQQRGQMDWAEMEFAAVVSQVEPLTHSGALGRWYFASHLYDIERYDEAATLLEELHAAINANTRSSRRYLQLLEQHSQSAAIEQLPEPDLIAARKCYYAGLSAKGAAATKQLRESLLLNREDADVLIAYYRSTAPTSTLRRDALRKIDALSHEFEAEILDEPSDPMPYNQWAWLVSNTEGDFSKAIRYSQRSLELTPGVAGYLDTLARCHYAAGDVEQAIATQSAAVVKEPHIPALTRQLKFFQQQKK
jgi:hypothetical protein